VPFLSARLLLLGCPSGFGPLELSLSATLLLLLSCLSGFGPLEFFLSATLLLGGCPSGGGLLEVFLSAKLLLAFAVGSLIAFCWLCRWFVFFHDVELAIGKKAG